MAQGASMTVATTATSALSLRLPPTATAARAVYQPTPDRSSSSNTSSRTPPLWSEMSVHEVR